MIKLLYPDRCPMCQQIAQGVCDTCAEKIRYAEAPLCFWCGKPLEEEEKEFCFDCRQHRHVFEQGRGLFLYQNPVKESIYRIKYQNRREYLDYFAKEMAEKLSRDIRKWNPQVLIPVPMYTRKMRQRGYNQAEILAKKLGEYLEIPMEGGVLKKIRQTRDQKELTQQQRRSNLKNAFSPDSFFLDKDGKLPWQRILLVDDVYTTGSTIDAAADILKQHGVKEVYFVTICIGEGAF